jgi:xanthine dehydrogenase accessory factor
VLELAMDLVPLLRSGEPVVVVSVTRVARSAPRGVGSSMAVTRSGRVIGSISGGCVEGDAVALAAAVHSDGRARSASFGFDDDTAHAAGMACGGAVDVIAYRLDAADPAMRDALDRAASDRPASIGIRLDGGPMLAESALRGAGAASAVALRESVVTTGPDGRLLIVSRAPRARLILVGAGEHAAALCRVATAAGFAVTVCDPWETLVTPERFPDADRLVVDAPDRYLSELSVAEIDARTAVCVLTHDERLDVPALRVALGMPVGFVGALGARRTVARRTELLRSAGVRAEDIAAIHAPLGLDLGDESPDAVAVSALAEILATRHGASARPLRDLTGPLHRRPDR